MTRSLLGLTALLAGCGFSAPDVAIVPDHPTFSADVLPVMDDHCNLCHGAKPGRGAPSGFRFDLYDDVGAVAGAAALAEEILASVTDDEMPPSASWGDGLGPNAKELLRRWVADGAPR